MTIEQPSNGETQSTTPAQANTPAEIPYQEYERARRSGKSLDEIMAPKSAPEAKATEQKKAATSEPADADVTDDESEDESDSQSGTDKSEDSEKDKPKKKGGFQRRIDKLNARHADAQREAEYWKAEALKNKSAGESKAPPTQAASSEGKPDPENFDTHSAYVEALTDWKVDQKQQQIESEKKKSELVREQESLLKSHFERVNSFKDKTEDFQDVIDNIGDIPMPMAIQEIIVSSENGPELMYALGKNREEFERICSLSPLAAARAIGKLETKLGSPSSESKESEPNKLTKAPKPLEPVSAGSSKVVKKSISDPEISFAEYERLRRDQMKRKRG